MIIFSSKKFDLDGSVSLLEDAPGQGIRSSTRRVSRTATLDGGVVIDDAGYTDGDRVFNVSIPNISQEDFNTLHRIHRLYSEHRCATEEGYFEGVIEDVSLDRGTASIRFLVSSKLSQ